MSVENFDHSCDRLSAIVDKALYDRLAWERNVGPKLERLVGLLKGAFAAREEFELSEEGATRDIKRYVIKVHGNRVLAVSVTIHNGQAVMAGGEIERSRFAVAHVEPITADPDAIDEEWMARALQSIFARVNPRNTGGEEAADNQAYNQHPQAASE
ncbi:hypothetical protein GRI89_11735 [Altererythrobacter salegens]|uniref:Uncharacterized protein n=1 Tax=Croceibacterium salegens TaxID=1737568 RepID=A0A6I4SYI7_9SPHN|nr:hypothetical protein [Croceibacterium salegens]MXO60210.1 hypothetical protein [Croceibacterium salegens]